MLVQILRSINTFHVLLLYLFIALSIAFKYVDNFSAIINICLALFTLRLISWHTNSVNFHPPSVFVFYIWYVKNVNKYSIFYYDGYGWCFRSYFIGYGLIINVCKKPFLICSCKCNKSTDWRLVFCGDDCFCHLTNSETK